MAKRQRASVVDPVIAKKAAKIFVPSQEEMALGRIFGRDRVREILEWGQSQGDPGLIGAVRRLVEIGLAVKRTN